MRAGKLPRAGGLLAGSSHAGFASLEAEVLTPLIVTARRTFEDNVLQRIGSVLSSEHRRRLEPKHVHGMFPSWPFFNLRGDWATWGRLNSPPEAGRIRHPWPQAPSVRRVKLPLTNNFYLVRREFVN